MYWCFVIYFVVNFVFTSFTVRREVQDYSVKPIILPAKSAVIRNTLVGLISPRPG